MSENCADHQVQGVMTGIEGLGFMVKGSDLAEENRWVLRIRDIADGEFPRNRREQLLRYICTNGEHSWRFQPPSRKLFLTGYQAPTRCPF